MIAAVLLLLQTATVPGPIGRQALPAQGCAAYLWSIGADRQLVAMAGADPARLRLSLDGKVRDLARAAQTGAVEYGLAETTEYRDAEVAVTLSLAIRQRRDVADGAGVPEGTLRIDRPGRDGIVVPVAGLIGCRPAAAARR